MASGIPHSIGVALVGQSRNRSYHHRDRIDYISLPSSLSSSQEQESYLTQPGSPDNLEGLPAIQERKDLGPVLRNSAYIEAAFYATLLWRRVNRFLRISVGQKTRSHYLFPHLRYRSNSPRNEGRTYLRIMTGFPRI
ncbi:hypothetical protein VNO80_33058 [Phaseolus coccineus]|uniref:Uncharacterized protein n=1 Tax=Phaseolus coccineus TaxID=3886 RepID=A0AAN9L3F4_PHACN